MVKKIFFLSIFILNTNCTQLISLAQGDFLRAGVSTAGDLIVKKTTGKTPAELTLSFATNKDCRLNQDSITTQKPCK
ncbi:hypothetical protein N9O05_01400 [Pelagibacteraceae bacterium]|jgi:hypothetical protein|nr:hypothetical protein [Pelagibacteraceae bacterium]MDB0036803.1 hypothetical protein [Pelagibacteraceae bacterium]|tara:strand:+ start:2215 stop:2445 length:231 start_codon:yes stop_codon:yes gene_type:complete